MNGDFGRDTVEGLQEMYASDPAARALFDWAAERKNDASETSISYMAQKAGTSEANATRLARRLDELECCQYIVGRRGGTSRVAWSYSLKSIGKAARGGKGKLDPLDPDLAAEAVEDRGGESTLTIAQAKKRLAATFGVSPDAIEITVRA